MNEIRTQIYFFIYQFEITSEIFSETAKSLVFLEAGGEVRYLYNETFLSTKVMCMNLSNYLLPVDTMWEPSQFE